MGWLGVGLPGAMAFIAWGFLGGWKIGWGGLLAFYPVFLLDLAVLYFSRPHGQKNVWQLANRFCWPLALAFMAEVFLRLEKTFGFLGFTLSLLAQIAVWVVVVIPAIASIYETARLWQGEGANVSALSSVSDFVFRFLDWWQNLPAENLELGQGDRVMLVREQSLWDSVYPALLERGAIALLIGTVVGFILAAVAFLYQGMQQLLAGEILNLSFQWWLILVVPLVFGVPVLTWTYFVAEWERRHFRYVFCLGPMSVVRASFNLSGATEYRSDGPTADIGELKRSSPGEQPGSENQTFWGQQWDAIRLRVGRVQDVHIPSRMLGAADWLHAVEHAAGFCSALSDVVLQAKKARGLKETVARLANEAVIDDTIKDTGWSSSSASGKADQIQQAYNRMVGAAGGTIDLWTVTDPGLYDRVTGQAQKAAGAVSSATLLTTFPKVVE